MQKLKFHLIILFSGGLFLLSNCKEINEDWLTPEWIRNKITILEDDCYYEGSTINRYIIDSIDYIDVYIPSNLWPEESVYFENGTKVIDSVTTFSYNMFKQTRGTAIEKIWVFPEGNNCP